MMIPRARLLLLQLLAFMAIATIPSSNADERRTYIVHLAEDSQQLNGVPNEKLYQSILDSVTKPLLTNNRSLPPPTKPELLYSYTTTMTGFAARLSISQSKTLTTLPNILMVTPDTLLQLHTTHTPQFLRLHSNTGVWNTTNLATDTVVGVLDTGIWPEHVSFSNHANFPPLPATWKGQCESGTNFSSTQCNRKLVGARAFFKGYEAINGRINETDEFRSPRDSNGHGTHTASTAAGDLVPGASLFGLGKGVASGMRFTSRVAAYKVCFASGCASSDILAAIDRAVSDGVNVISLSLGGPPRPYYRDSMAVATLGAVRKGVFVSCSAGNSGPSPSSVGNMAPWMLTVGANYIDRTFQAIVKLSNGKRFVGTSLYTGKQIKNLPMAYKDTAGSTSAEFCIDGSLSAKLVKGKIVLCERGITSRAKKGEVVKSAGGAGMLLLNSNNQGDELISDAHILPAANLGATAAKLIKSYLLLSNNTLTASVTFKGTVYGTRAPIMAAFSSRGPSLVDPTVIKPDITGPGVNILAAWPPVASPTELDTDRRRVLFNIVSGTSMSCPHLSGIAALVLSAHPKWSPAAVKSAIMTTAYTHDNRGGRIRDIKSPKTIATPFSFGSGHVDPNRAADPGLIYDINSTTQYLNYLCIALNYTDQQVSVLARAKYTCPKTTTSTADLNYPSFAMTFNARGKEEIVTTMFKRTVTNVGHGTGSGSYYEAVVRQPKGVKVSVVPKVLKFRVVGEKQEFVVKVVGSSRKFTAGSESFGDITWVSRKYCVRSPIAVMWM